MVLSSVKDIPACLLINLWEEEEDARQINASFFLSWRDGTRNVGPTLSPARSKNLMDIAVKRRTDDDGRSFTWSEITVILRPESWKVALEGSRAEHVSKIFHPHNIEMRAALASSAIRFTKDLLPPLLFFFLFAIRNFNSFLGALGGY